MKGQRVAHIAQVTCFENIVRIRRLIHPPQFFSQSLRILSSITGARLRENEHLSRYRA